MAAMKVGVIGAGVISEQYLENLTKAPSVSIEMIADLDPTRSEQRARQYGVPTFGTPEELLAREDIELVVNLTIPKAHEEVTIAALKAGKHVWSEKPLALDKASAARIRHQALESGREVCCAPDTFLDFGWSKRAESAKLLVRLPPSKFRDQKAGIPTLIFSMPRVEGQSLTWAPTT